VLYYYTEYGYKCMCVCVCVCVCVCTNFIIIQCSDVSIPVAIDLCACDHSCVTVQSPEQTVLMQR